jgi:translation initiation factor 2B subunit (eIF-2B alpha/beta/delta family)/ADP-ribose pyrophosphatase YjhB (NUDIX family)
MNDPLEEVAVVTCFLRHDAQILLLRRSDAVGSYSGRWGAVAGHAEGDPDAAARAEIREETGMDPDTDVTLVRVGEAFPVVDRDRGTRWLVHPYLFDAATREVVPNEETAEYEWVPPTEILRRETVPDLWRSYDRVRPRVETVAADRDHGSTYLSVRALDVLRDEAGVATVDESDESDALTDLRSVAAALRDARPSMPVVENRVNRAMHAASEGTVDAPTRTPDAVERAAIDTVDRALSADSEAAAVAADYLGAGVATLSRSGTVLAALERADPEAVLVAESRPGGEGRATAEAVAARTDAEVTVTTDAAFAGRLVAADAETFLVGADAVLPDGRVVNKVGTRAAATVATREGLDCYAVTALDKVATREAFDAESRDPTEVYDGDADVAVANPTFEATPADRFDAVLTERGALDAADLAAVADDHRERADW